MHWSTEGVIMHRQPVVAVLCSGMAAEVLPLKLLPLL